MIVFDLQCRDGGHRFEGWFGTSEDYESQQARGLLSCPVCASAEVGKAIMAPNVGRKGNQLPQRAVQPAPTAAQPAPGTALAAPPAALPPEAAAMLQALARAQAEAIKTSRWVGDRFADQARAIHYGETDPGAIHGQATLDEARELLDEGIAVAPLLIPVVPPEQAN